MGKEITFGSNVRSRILEGVKIIESAVITTLGPKGKNVLIDKGTVDPLITKDGVTVAKSIYLSDRYKNLGVLQVKDVASRVNNTAGDGTTTSTLLVSEAMLEGCRIIDLGFDPNDIRKGMILAKEDLIKEIKKQSRVVSSVDDLFNIATISANNDQEIGRFVCDAYANVGNDGLVIRTPATNKTGQTEIEYIQGLQFERGFNSSAYNNTKDEACEFDDALVLLAKKLPEYEELKIILDYAKKENAPLVIMAPYYDDDLGGQLITDAKEGTYKICCCYCDGVNADTIIDNLNDIAMMLNCKVLNYDGYTMANFAPQADLGKIKHFRAEKRKTVFSGANPDKKAFEKHTDEIRKALRNEAGNLTEFELKQLSKRLARLTGGIANIKVGYTSKIELEEKLARYVDACCAVRAAITDGIVPGGGSTLLKCSHILKENMKKKKFENDVIKKGYELVLKIARLPAKEIIKSVDPERVDLFLAQIEEHTNDDYGYNAKTEQFCNLFEAGVIDPLLVEVSAVNYAITNAAVFITTDCVITDEPSPVSATPIDEIMLEDDD